MCFPDAHVWPFTADDCRMYSLTVTDENGQRYYGYCCRVQPEGAAYCLPLVYCLYSSTKANSFYFKVNSIIKKLKLLLTILKTIN